MDYATATDSEEGELTTKVENSNVDTSKPTKGEPYHVTYSATNSKGKNATKTISVVVNPNKEIVPTIEVLDKTMYVGNVLTEDDILSRAKTTNTKNLTFKVTKGGPIVVTKSGNKLIEKGQYNIQYIATSSDGTTAIAQMVLTVNDVEGKKVGTTNFDDPKVTNTGAKNLEKKVSINSKNMS